MILLLFIPILFFILFMFFTFFIFFIVFAPFILLFFTNFYFNKSVKTTPIVTIFTFVFTTKTTNTFKWKATFTANLTKFFFTSWTFHKNFTLLIVFLVYLVTSIAIAFFSIIFFFFLCFFCLAQVVVVAVFVVLVFL